jgi:lysophosphatidate acyltransferase
VNKITGLTIEIEDSHGYITSTAVPPTASIILANHQNEIDVLLIGRLFPKYTTVTAKKILKYIPILGWFMTLSGSVFLDRSNRERSIQTLSTAVTTMQHTRQNLFLFPEGTRSYTPTPALLPLKKGAFHLAVQGQFPIIPVVVSNTAKIWRTATQDKVIPGGLIRVKVLDPIPTVGLTPADVNALVARVEVLMRAEVEKIGYSEIHGLDNNNNVEEQRDIDEATPLIEN